MRWYSTFVTGQSFESHNAPSAQTPSTPPKKQTSILTGVILLISILYFYLFFVQNFDWSY